METPIRSMALPAQLRVTALAEGATVMFHPQPLHQLPSQGINHNALQQLRPSWQAAGLLLDAGSAPSKGGRVMLRSLPLHQLPSLGISHDALQQLCPSWQAAGLFLDAGSALTKGGQVMFRPQPLLELSSLRYVC